MQIKNAIKKCAAEATHKKHIASAAKRMKMYILMNTTPHMKHVFLSNTAWGNSITLVRTVIHRTLFHFHSFRIFILSHSIGNCNAQSGFSCNSLHLVL